MITTNIDKLQLQEFFGRNDWYCWLTADEIDHLITSAVHAAVAVSDEHIVGFVLITGDGRVITELDSLVVDRDHRGQGIGTELLKYAIAEVEKLKPHFFQVKAKQSKLEGFYAKFGFMLEEDQLVLSHEPTAARLRAIEPGQ